MVELCLEICVERIEKICFGFWCVWICLKDGILGECFFDYFFVVLGYFGKLVVFGFDVIFEYFEVFVIYSSKYWNLKDMFGGGKFKGGKIFVVGG